MATDFEVSVADLVVHADFATPAFDLLLQQSNLLTNVYAGLTPHGLRLGDMRVERSGPSVASNSLECTLLDFLVAVRFRLDRVEVQAFDCMRVKLPTVLKIAAEAGRIVKASSPEVSFKSASCTLAMHGVLAGTSGLDFVRQFVTSSPRIGSLTSAGATFLFGAQNEVTSSLLGIEPSALVPLGLFLKLVVALAGAGAEPEALPSIGEGRLRGMLTQLGFAVHGL